MDPLHPQTLIARGAPIGIHLFEIHEKLESYGNNPSLTPTCVQASIRDSHYPMPRYMEGPIPEYFSCLFERLLFVFAMPPMGFLPAGPACPDMWSNLGL